MKRDHPNPLQPEAASSGKAKMWEDDSGAVADGCMDEFLEVMGYKVRNSDMAVVAQKLEQLEEVLSREDGLSQVASDSVHYNPADLSTWLESMLSEINPEDSITPPPSQTGFLDDSCYLTPPESSLTSLELPNGTNFGKLGNNLLFDESSSSDYDLKAIPGKAVLSSSSSSTRDPKRLKTSVCPEPARTVVIESQENGVRLVHLLMACAESVQKGNLAIAEALVKEIGLLAVSQAGAMRKVATYFAEALARRIYNLHPDSPLHHSLSQLLHLHFYETCPYLKFAHFTANQAILEAFEGKTYVHVIDFSINQGMQWPALIQALALRPGGPPAFRLTGIGPPSDDNSDHLQQVGWKLAQLAETIRVQFEYRGFVASSLADLDAAMLEFRPTECVAVNSVFELHKLHARPGAFEKVMNVIKQIKPDIFTIVEQEANHNGPVFLDRFTESLHYYSTLFDSLESSAPTQDKVMSEMYLGKEICNVVACEGVDRVERHESLDMWRSRLSSGGFVPVHLGSNAFKQARMLLALYAGVDGYKVEEDNGSLMLGWHTRPLIATSAWRLACKPVGAQ